MFFTALLLASAPVVVPDLVQDVDYQADVAFALEELEEQCGRFFKLKDIDWKDVTKEFTKAAKDVEMDEDEMELMADAM